MNLSVDTSFHSLHDQLWSIFTFYTLAGDPKQPNMMRLDMFVRFAEDCKVLEKRSILKADLNVIATHEASKQSTKSKRGVKTKAPRGLGYHAFLTCLSKLANKMYPNADKEREQAALSRFVQTDVLPHAQRRNPSSMVKQMSDTKVQSLLKRFEIPLSQIFRYYATASIRTGIPGVVSPPSSPTGRSPKSLSSSGGPNMMKDEMKYVDFMNFAKDFGLASSTLISTFALGDIFLSSIDKHAFHKTVPKLCFPEFLEAIVRCACALSDIAPKNSSTDHLVKALFLIMWRAIHAHFNLTHAIESHVPKNVNASDILQGTMSFNNKFTTMWAEDGNRDYLSPIKPKTPDAFDMISKICLEG